MIRETTPYGIVGPMEWERDRLSLGCRKTVTSSYMITEMESCGLLTQTVRARDIAN